MKAAVALVQTLPRARAPRSVAEGVSRGIAASARVRRLDVWRRSALWVTAAAAGLFIASNVLFFSKLENAPAPPASSAARRSAAPVVAVVPPSSADKADAREADRARAFRSEAGAAESRRELAEKEKADGALRGAGRPAADEKLAKLDAAAHGETKKAAPEPARDAAAPTAKPSAPPAPKEEAKQRDDLALARKLAEDRKAGPAAPGAAAPPAAPPKPPAAAPAPDPKLAAAAPPPSVYVAAGRNALTCQNVVDGWNRRNVATRAGNELRQQEQRPSVASGAPGGGLKSASQFGKVPMPPEPMVVEVTDAELAELQKELARQGYVISAATPEQNKLGYVDLPIAAADGKDAQKDAAPKAQSAAQVLEGQRAKEAPAAEGAAKNAQSVPSLRRITIWFVEEPVRK
jgi:hypothetical protein